MRVKCFKPVIDKNCKILILGSMPSVKSREVQFYYGNPSNRFWKILSKITGADFIAMTKEEKINELLVRHIALFDVFSSCEITGSSDGTIKNAELNDILSLIAPTDIRKIYVTSKKAFVRFTERYGKELDALGVKVINLPSPSAANRAKFRTDDSLLSEWKRLLSL